jgi:GNAT superfamily N-acetyltransferase
MAEVEIRQAISIDILELVKFDHGCETTHVWQLDSNINDIQIETFLREIKLPRSLHLAYPRRPELILDTWTRHTLFLVAICNGKISGYLILDQRQDLKSAMVSDLVVNTPMRRQGIATALIFAAQEWAKKQNMTRFMLEVPAKAHPYQELARKLNFENNGYIDNFYSNQDIAMFFVKPLK